MTLLVTPDAIVTDHLAAFSPVLNLRTMAFTLLIAATGFTLRRFRPLDGPSLPVLRGALHCGWVALVVLLSAAETLDTFRKAADVASHNAHDHFLYLIGLVAPLSWTFFATALVWTGRRLSNRTLVWIAVCVALLAFLTTVSWSLLGFVPLEWFRPATNIRALGLFLIGFLLFLHAGMLTTFQGPLRRTSEVIHATWIVILFVMLTAEVMDFFSLAMRMGPAASIDELAFSRIMWLGGIWTLCGTGLLWYATRTSTTAPVVGGLVIGALGIGVAGVRGIAYDPVTAAVPLVNIRAAVMVLVAACMLLQIGLLRAIGRRVQWVNELPGVVRIVCALLLLSLITGEIRDFYEARISMLEGDIGRGADLEDLKQLFLSSAWLLYSIGLMAYGIGKRVRSLRILSIILFGIAILKIFIYDLSFLDTLYRIFSFIGLGVILLIVSYLYQRYREAIFGDGSNSSAVTS
jgi:hypothetical protein